MNALQSLSHSSFFPLRGDVLLLVASAALLCPTGNAAEPQTSNQSAEARESKPADEPVQLSIFTVNTSRDQGYRATNTISGTSLDTPIRLLPMPIEVITSEFITDLQATDFKEAMAYSAGVFTDQFTESTTTNSPGANKAHSAEVSPSTRGGLGGDFSNAINIRGFNVQFQNRLGFRVGGTVSQYGVTLGGILDSLNYERIEVVRGPSSLLYGIGVLSGIANIIPKRPLPQQRVDLSASFGSYQYQRHTAEVTGPLKSKWIPGELRYRVGIAHEERGDWTEFKTKRLDYEVAQFTYAPWRTVDLFVEYQHGDTLYRGTGVQFLYDNLDANAFGALRNQYNEQINWARDLGGKGPDFRISGPDTYAHRKEWNTLADLNVHPLPGLSFNLGGYWGAQQTSDFDIRIQTVNNQNSTLFVKRTLPDGQGGFAPFLQDVPDNIVTAFANPSRPFRDTTDYKAVGYYWVKDPKVGTFSQYRARVNYEFKTPFIGGEAKHNFLLGRQDIKDVISYSQGSELIPRLFIPVNLVGDPNARPSADDSMVFRSIADTSPIRYQGELLAQPGFRYLQSELWYTGEYAIYQVSFWHDRLMLIAGLRHDRYQSKEKEYDRHNGTVGLIDNPDNNTYGFKSSKYNFDLPVNVRTKTSALRYDITKDISVYALAAEGVSPNTGALDGNDRSIDPERSLSKEIGLKWDLLEGKLSGTLSVYEIGRRNAIWNLASAPRPSSWTGGSDHNNLRHGGGEDFDPQEIKDGRAVINYGVDSRYFDPKDLQIDPATKKYKRGIVGIDSEFNDTATPQTVVFLDYTLLDETGFRKVIERAFADKSQSRSTTGNGIDPIIYSRTKGTANGENPSNDLGANVTFSDRARGVDLQLIYSPLPNWQLIFNYAHTQRVVTSPFQMVDAQDQLTGAMFGTEYDSWVRTFGRAAFGFKETVDSATGLPTQIQKNGTTAKNGDARASAESGGVQGLSLFFGAKDQASFWSKITVEQGRLHNLSFLLGTRYTGPEATGVRIGDAQLAENLYLTPPTQALWQVDTGLIYKMRRNHRDWRFSLNIYNLLDVQKLYSQANYTNVLTQAPEVRRTAAYQEPRNFRFSASVGF